ncbi:hypothetical protein EMIT053CA3_120115 [Pseudomonas donghuensis]
MHLVNCVLDDVNTAYPGFDARFSVEDAPSGALNRDPPENPWSAKLVHPTSATRLISHETRHALYQESDY